jgi:hypothetical protein
MWDYGSRLTLVPKRNGRHIGTFGGGLPSTGRGLVDSPLDKSSGDVGNTGEQETDTESSHRS